jgi:flagellar biosynthesis protein FlhB
MIKKIFSPKNLAKTLAFLLKLLLVLEKMIITLVYDTNAIFSLKIGQKRRKS